MSCGYDACRALRRVVRELSTCTESYTNYLQYGYEQSSINEGYNGPVDISHYSHASNSLQGNGTEMSSPVCDSCGSESYADIFREQEYESDYEVQWHGNLLV